MAAKAAVSCKHCEQVDEYEIECDEAIKEDVKRIAENAIVWAGKHYKISCPHVGDGTIGKNWYEVH